MQIIIDMDKRHSRNSVDPRKNDVRTKGDVTFMTYILTILTVLTFAETILQFVVLSRTCSDADDTTACACALTVILLAHLAVNVASALLVYRTMAFQQDARSLGACALLHFLQLGQVWRCCKYVITRDPEDAHEHLLLRTVQTSVQNGGFLIFLGHAWCKNDRIDPVSLVCLCVMLVSLSLSYAAQDAMQRRRYGDGVCAKQPQCGSSKQVGEEIGSGRVSTRGSLVIFLRSLNCVCVVVLRSVCLLQLAITFQLWSLAGVALHCVVLGCCVYVIRSNVRRIVGVGFKDFAWNLLHVFHLNRVHENTTLYETFAFHALNFVELAVTVFSGYYMARCQQRFIHVASILNIALLILSFICLFCLQLCASCLHSDFCDAPEVSNHFQQHAAVVSNNTSVACTLTSRDSALSSDAPSQVLSAGGSSQFDSSLLLHLRSASQKLDRVHVPQENPKPLNSSLSSTSSGVAVETNALTVTSDVGDASSMTSVEFIELDIDPVHFVGGHSDSFNHLSLAPLLMPSKPRQLLAKRPRRTQNRKKQGSTSTPQQTTTQTIKQLNNLRTTNETRKKPEQVERRHCASDTSCSLTFCDECCERRTASESSHSSDSSFTMTWPPAKTLPPPPHASHLPQERVPPADNIKTWLRGLENCQGHFDFDPSCDVTRSKAEPARAKRGWFARRRKKLHRDKQQRDFRKSVYKFERFGSPLPWRQESQEHLLPDRRDGVAREVRRARVWHCLRSMRVRPPKAHYPCNVDGSYRPTFVRG